MPLAHAKGLFGLLDSPFKGRFSPSAGVDGVAAAGNGLSESEPTTAEDAWPGSSIAPQAGIL